MHTVKKISSLLLLINLVSHEGKCQYLVFGQEIALDISNLILVKNAWSTYVRTDDVSLCDGGCFHIRNEYLFDVKPEVQNYSCLASNRKVDSVLQAPVTTTRYSEKSEKASGLKLRCWLSLSVDTFRHKVLHEPTGPRIRDFSLAKYASKDSADQYPVYRFLAGSLISSGAINVDKTIEFRISYTSTTSGIQIKVCKFKRSISESRSERGSSLLGADDIKLAEVVVTINQASNTSLKYHIRYANALSKNLNYSYRGNITSNRAIRIWRKS